MALLALGGALCLICGSPVLHPWSQTQALLQLPCLSDLCELLAWDEGQGWGLWSTASWPWLLRI